MLKLMMLTHDAIIAKCAQDAGVDRIFYDLEYINKRERQVGRNTVISEYDIDGIADVKKVLTTSELLVRVNPIYFNSENEIEEILKYKPDYLMLPMVIDDSDVKKFISIINGRAKPVIMIETVQSLARLDSILEIDGISEIFIGLNDLHIGLGLDFMFEIVSDGLLDYITEKCNKKGIDFGFGGIARIGQGDLPSENILAEHIRTGSKTVILSRSFKGSRDGNENAVFEFDFKQEIKKIRDRENECALWTDKQFADNRAFIKKQVRKMIENGIKK